ncbi:molybdopterin biosynthesis protein [Pseudovirgaria hyperparasitica]|uniref:molybdopterin adenylyltransferase n=1 Tax=Pseudovirgaria hyperparasitica TaxID=470096 RepID=A0A6A6W2A4_9PEZI|nr:molybdopterin biosynthesis protein [Pseudovirgaria hyperparasitica]KAF2755151.1 molybdopterin biosynthesis protein [Pseudovirgaria hyperparasitica]
MTVSYQEALNVILQQAEIQRETLPDPSELVALEKAVGRVASHCYEAVTHTPSFDCAATNGYAVCSALTSEARNVAPITFFVYGTQAAGDNPMTVPGVRLNGAIPCVEITTGARFPKASTNMDFDACVPFEDTIELPGKIHGCKQIQIRRPVLHNAHRRLADDDFHLEDEVLRSGMKVTSQHILALASLGVQTVAVKKIPRVGVWSTGKELESRIDIEQRRDRVPDANGPYIISALEELGIDAEFLGIIDDEEEAIKQAVTSANRSRFDILITTGGTSEGRFDNVRSAIEACGAEVLFSKIAVQPGSPTLFATIPRLPIISSCRMLSPQPSNGDQFIAFFGLPGGPVAAAACMKFFVAAYIKQWRCEPGHESLGCHLLNISPQSGTSAKSQRLSTSHSRPQESDVFKHGTIAINGSTAWAVPSPEQNDSKIKSFLKSSCWMHLPAGPSTKSNGDVVRCYSIQEGDNIIEKIIFGHERKDETKSASEG